MVYRFFCCSDTHGELPPVPSSADGRIDGTLHAGDVYNGAELFRDRRETRVVGAAEWVDPDEAEIARWIEQAGPVYVVRGNHDLADPHRFFARSQDVTGRVVRLGESLLLAGIGWHGDRYYELPGESEIERCVRAYCVNCDASCR